MARLVAKVALAAIAAIAVASASGACLDPTQITIHVRSNVPCPDSKGTAFTGGKPGAVEHAKPSTVTMDCKAGEIGTLVATPADGSESAAAFLVVQGVDRPALECAANGYKGCIVQRRILRYIAHTPLTLPVTMHLACKDVACDEFSTCAKSGKCVSATIANPESCANGVCLPEGEELDDPADGSAGDGGDGAPSGGDGSTGDGSAADSATDAPADVVVDAPPPPPPGSLYCPLTAGCAAGVTCCWSRQGALGRCLPGGGCTSNELPMLCNRKSDCTGGQYCCADAVFTMPPPPPEYQFPDTHCALPPAPCVWICIDDGDCPMALRCDKSTPHFTPQGYFGECK